MNTLGQLKTLLDIQTIRGFSDSPSNTSLRTDNSVFEDMLQQSLAQATTFSYKQSHSLNMNTLGAVFRTSQFGGSFTELASSMPIDSSLEAIGGRTEPFVQDIETIIQRAAEKYNLPPKLISSVIKHESNFNPSTVSRAGASGLMQLMPATARSLGVTDIFDPLQNIMGGSKYLRSMLDKYEGNIELALAAYNAGPGNVDKYGGIPPFNETQGYVKKVTGSYYS